MSYACAAENGTDVVAEKTDEVISVDESSNNISKASDDDIVEYVAENSSLNSTGGVLSTADATEILALTSDDVLNSTVEVKLASSNTYKTPTKKQRTFNIGGFKAVLSTSQYKKLYMISSIEDQFFDEGYNDYYYVGEKFRGYDITSSGLRYNILLKTNKYIKIKAKMGKKVYYKKSRVYMIFSYGEGQVGVAYRHMVFLTHYYATKDLRFNNIKVLGSAAKYFGKCRTNANFAKIKQSKLTSTNYVYRKYSVY